MKSMSEIQYLLENEREDELTERECLVFLSMTMDIPIETLEARLSLIRGEKLLTYGDMSDGDYEV